MRAIFYFILPIFKSPNNERWVLVIGKNNLNK